MRRFSTFRLTLIALCAVLNGGVGFVVQLLKLPVYLDLIGSVLAAAILGPLEGVAVAILGIIVLGLTTTANAYAYVGTAIVVTLLASLFTRWGYLQRWPQTIMFGLLLGIVSALVSAPVTAYLFGGISFVGTDAVTAFFRAMGQTISTSVFLGALSTDPIDKLLVSLICFVLLRNLPQRLKDRLKYESAFARDP